MGAASDSKRPRALEWVAVSATVSLLVAHLLVERGTNPTIRALGVAALLLAHALFIPPLYLLKKHGQVESGKSFYRTTRVVDRGVYRIVRHPQYLGYMVLACGLAMLTQSIVTWALAALAVTFFYLHAVDEERFCAQQLGIDYAAYMERVPRFNIFAGLLRAIAQRRESRG